MMEVEGSGVKDDEEYPAKYTFHTYKRETYHLANVDTVPV